LSFTDIEHDLMLCKEHLDKTKTTGTEVESFLTHFLLINICGKYEKEIKRIVSKRANKSGDVELTSFIEETFESYKHLNLDDLRGKILRKFSDKYAVAFDKMIRGTVSELRYQSIVSNRHASAHGGNINMTLDDLVVAHKEAKLVLQALHDSLNS